jgi:predicted alpha/beta superfamily hydrolase
VAEHTAHHHMRRLLFPIVCLLSAGGGRSLLHAQYPPVVLPNTQQRILRSSINDVTYKLYVSLPADYDSSAARYPVIYVLDADYAFAIARNIVEHLSDRHHLTRALIVGIAYDGPPAYRMNRTRDYTPTHVPTGGYGPAHQAGSGGGPRFHHFLADELIPFVRREYRVTERRVLVGHSFGGLFAAWSALEAPRLFTGYVIVSPSLWYDDHLLFETERTPADTTDDLPVRMYLAVGSDEINATRDMVSDLRHFATMLERRGYRGLALRWAVDDNETHNSIFPRALSDGLRFVLRGR